MPIVLTWAPIGQLTYAGDSNCPDSKVKKNGSVTRFLLPLSIIARVLPEMERQGLVQAGKCPQMGRCPIALRILNASLQNINKQVFALEG
jgi:hypothetical protein